MAATLPQLMGERHFCSAIPKLELGTRNGLLPKTPRLRFGLVGRRLKPALQLALVDGQEGFVELEHNEVAGGDVEEADVAGPGAVGLLVLDDVAVELVAERLPVLVALAVHDLRVIEIRVVPVAEAVGAFAEVLQVLLAEL